MRIQPIRFACLLPAIALTGCSELFSQGGIPGDPEIPRPEGYRNFVGFVVEPVSVSGYHREPVLASRIVRDHGSGFKDTSVALTGGAIWGARVTVQVRFRWAGTLKDPAAPAPFSVLGHDRDRPGSALPDSQVAWKGKPLPASPDSSTAAVTYAFRGPARLSVTAMTAKGKSESIREPVATQPARLFDFPMPEAEGDSLLRPFQGEWSLAARTTSCGRPWSDSIVYGDTGTVWAGSPSLLPWSLKVEGRAALAGAPDASSRDSILFFTGGRFRARDPMLHQGSRAPGARWNHPISWSGSAETLVLTQYENRASGPCREEWVFARGATLDRLRGAP